MKRWPIVKHKPFLRIGEFHALMELLLEPHATMVYVAVSIGLRVSELIGLRCLY